MIMKLLPLLMTLPLGLGALPVQAGFQHHYGRNGYSGSRCYQNVVQERYIPGNQWRRGRIHRWTERREVPCEYGSWSPRPEPRYHPQQAPQQRPAANLDNNSCIEGAILGGILGGGAGYAASRGDGRGWAIPLGVVGGALVGCQVDGG